MADFHIQPSQLQGSLIVPPSKSHTLRAILFAALARGTSKIEQFLPSPDTTAMIEAVRLLGAEVIYEPRTLLIKGFAGKPKIAEDVIQCGNAGQVLRFVGALAGLIPQYTILTGDNSIRHNRPIQPLLDALNQLGAFAVSSRGDGYAPVLIKGPLTQGIATLDGQDSQPVSGLLIVGAFAPHPIELHVTNPGETPWIELTLDWFKRLGIPYQAKDYTYYRMEGSSQIDGFHYIVPGDFSTAAFPIAAALLTHSELTLHNVDLDDIQGDKAIIPVLQQMGAQLIIDKTRRTLTVKKSPSLKGMRIDINDFVDALPILSVIGCFAEGSTEIVNAAIARKKESDRISAVACELKKMGARVEEKPDGLIIHASPLHGAKLDTYHDHRLALSLSVASLAAHGPSTVHGIECASKTYPNFLQDFQAIGAQINS
jgi:3-phosphoshikimate 1-carboxyvinyltransferase